LQKRAKKGDRIARIALGQYSYTSKNPAQRKQAVKWLTLAAKQNMPSAMNWLSNIYAEGKVVKKNSKKALYWLQKAVQAGSDDAMLNMGLYYFHGAEGLKKNKKAAFALFKKSAFYNNAYAQYWVAKLYLTGEGVNKNLIAGENWLHLSAYNFTYKFGAGQNLLEYNHHAQALMAYLKGKILDTSPHYPPHTTKEMKKYVRFVYDHIQRTSAIGTNTFISW